MTDGWVEPEYSQDILIAAGRLALSFAALDVGLAMVLSNDSAKCFQKLCEKPLSRKLDIIKRIKKSKEKLRLIPINRIRELAKLRNDLMHGFAWMTIYPSVGEELTLWNPARDRTTAGVTRLTLDKTSEQVEAITRELPIKSIPGLKRISN